jgi:hypothetical protein
MLLLPPHSTGAETENITAYANVRRAWLATRGCGSKCDWIYTDFKAQVMVALEDIFIPLSRRQHSRPEGLQHDCDSSMPTTKHPRSLQCSAKEVWSAPRRAHGQEPRCPEHGRVNTRPVTILTLSLCSLSSLSLLTALVAFFLSVVITVTKGILGTRV